MLTLTVGDTGAGATATGTCNAVITGATLALNIKRPDGTVFTEAASIVDGAAGTWSAEFESGDLTVSGEYLVEVQVTYSGGDIQTFALDTAGKPVKFYVRDDYA